MYSNSSPATGNGNEQDSRPVRLRAACNPCHNAKIRCSGERDGCTRCRNLNHVHACKYSVSWVGRSSAKNKRARSPEETESPDKVSRPNSTGVPAWESGVVSGRSNNMPDLFDDQSIDWATLDRPTHDLDLSNLSPAKPDYFYWPVPQPSKSCDSPLGSPQEFGRSMPPPLFESQSTVPRAGYEPSESNQPILDISQPPTTQPQEQQQQQQRQRFLPSYSESNALTSPSSQPSLSYSHSISSATSSNNSNNTSNADPGVALCTQIISHLDSHIGDGSLGLDGILRISKSYLSGLLHVTSLESCKVNPNCLLLLCVAVNQMITLFENSISAMDSLSHPPHPRSAAAAASALPSLIFGSFQIDHEDGLAFCTRLVGREIQRCRQLLDRTRGIHHLLLQQSQTPNDTANSAASLLQKQWFLALAGRLDGLVAAVTA